MLKIAFLTLGCKVNQADSASMELLFRKAGHASSGAAKTAQSNTIAGPSNI
jgi:tRNA A37 methylthiotransferase MiaB